MKDGVGAIAGEKIVVTRWVNILLLSCCVMWAPFAFIARVNRMGRGTRTAKYFDVCCPKSETLNCSRSRVARCWAKKGGPSMSAVKKWGWGLRTKTRERKGEKGKMK